MHVVKKWTWTLICDGDVVVFSPRLTRGLDVITNITLVSGPHKDVRPGRGPIPGVAQPPGPAAPIIAPSDSLRLALSLAYRQICPASGQALSLPHPPCGHPDDDDMREKAASFIAVAGGGRNM